MHDWKLKCHGTPTSDMALPPSVRKATVELHNIFCYDDSNWKKVLVTDFFVCSAATPPPSDDSLASITREETHLTT